MRGRGSDRRGPGLPQHLVQVLNALPAKIFKVASKRRIREIEEVIDPPDGPVFEALFESRPELLELLVDPA